MSKMKKYLLTGISYVLVAALAIGGTIAYLQDSDEDVNVMTLGNVQIEQHEYERVVNADGTYATDTIDNKTSYVLQGFTQAKPLYPIVGDPNEPGDSPAYKGYDEDITVRMSQVGSYGGMQVFAGKNAQDKFVTVENTGKTDAYVRTLVALEMGNLDAAKFDKVVRISSRSTTTENDFLQPWLKKTVGVIEVDGNNYVLVEFIYHGAQTSSGMKHANGILPAGDTTYPSLCQVYLKHNATNEDMVALDGNENGTYDILVLSQAVQAAGFENAKTALDTAFGANTTTSHPWTNGVKLPVVVTSAEGLKAAIDAGKEEIVVKGATIADKLNFGSKASVTLVDCTINGSNNQWSYAKNATFVDCTFDSGSENAAIHFDRLYGEAVFTNCNFKSGKVQIGNSAGASATFNNCVFGETTSTSIWAEKGMRFYCPVEFNNCEFNNRVVLAGSAGLALTFNSCTMNGGDPVYYVDNTDGIIRGGNVPTVTIK